MNIRYDSKSIRIRVTQEEAETLLHVGHLTELIWLPSGLTNHSVHSSDCEHLMFSQNTTGTLRIDVPRVAFEAHVSGGAELLSQKRAGADSCEVRFEIDRFSKRKRSNG